MNCFALDCDQRAVALLDLVDSVFMSLCDAHLKKWVDDDTDIDIVQPISKMLVQARLRLRWLTDHQFDSDRSESAWKKYLEDNQQLFEGVVDEDADEDGFAEESPIGLIEVAFISDEQQTKDTKDERLPGWMRISL